MNFIISVCDNAKDEVCPIWIGYPVNLYWGLPEPVLDNLSYEEQ
jgi:arsenate reductase (thioredoxin)